jgi:hypothetical protein
VGAAGEIVFKEGNRRGEAIPAGQFTGFSGIQSKFLEQATDAQAENAEVDDLLAFMQTGFTLVHLGCNAYIEQKADRQRSISVARDSFAPLTALVTGIIGLANDGDTDSDYLTALALATSAISAGFDIYEERFLFGAQNVNEVRTLILKNQLAHADQAMTEVRANPSYNQAIIHLLRNQMTCSPAEILEKVNEAIKAGSITARTTNAASSEVDETATEADAAVARFDRLVERLAEDEMLTEDQLTELVQAIDADLAMQEEEPELEEVNALQTGASLNTVITRVE